MRLLFVLCAFTCFGTSSAYAQELCDAQCLHDAAFAHHPYQDTLHVQPAPYGVMKFGRLVVEPRFMHVRSAESWRLPESGQNVTTTQLQFWAYAEDHPLFGIGARALMRSGKHAQPYSSSDPASFAERLGHEPSEQKVMVDLLWLFDHNK